MTGPCAEHEALLQIALERVKRLEAAVQGLLDAVSDPKRAYIECAGGPEAAWFQAKVDAAHAALRPEST